MEKENNKKKVGTLISAIIVVLVLIIGITYSYLSANNKTPANSVKAGTLLISYEDDNLNAINVSNIQPIYDKDIKEKASKISFQVNNTGTAKAFVDINITDISLPSELADLEFKWALYSGEEKISNGNFRNVLDNKLLLTNNQEISSKGNKSYDLYIWISENELDQSDMMEKTFSGKITVVGHQNKQAELLSKVIKDNNEPSTQKPDFSKIAETDEGLIQDIDDDGETYYFRGNVKDNYLRIDGLKWPADAPKAYLIPSKNNNSRSDDMSYLKNLCKYSYSDYGYSNEQECLDDIKEVGGKPGEDMLFRIVRINGDGTIRIVADGFIGNKAFNQNRESEEYVGYTYNNSKPNVQDGDDSTIKEYLDSWYETNMIDYDNILASTRYCNDTTGNIDSNGLLLYGTYGRLNTDSGHIPEPSYICPNTDKLYGGEYDLKIGLLSADEAVFAGGKKGTSNSNYYLLGNSPDKWLGSPIYFSNGYAFEFNIASSGTVNDVFVNYEYAAVPVLNLRADTLFTQGNGEVNNPYVVKIQ